MPPAPVVRFALHAACFVALQAGVLVALLPFAYEPGNFMSAVIDKHARLDHEPGEPRLIVAGGSATAFGLDSPRIEEATGRRVTNLALHAGLGLPFIMSEAASAARPGDVIWLAPEYHLFFRPPVFTEEQWTTACARPTALLDMRWFSVKKLLDHGPILFGGHVVRCALRGMGLAKSVEHPIYRRSGFNDWGDFVGHAGLKPTQRPLSDRGGDIPPYTPETLRANLDLLERGVRGCQRAGAEVSIVLPPLHEDEFQLMRERIAILVAEFERIAPGKVIGDLGTVATPDRCFYDTSYHLTRPAAEEHTARLLEKTGFARAAP